MDDASQRLKFENREARSTPVPELAKLLKPLLQTQTADEYARWASEVIRADPR